MKTSKFLAVALTALGLASAVHAQTTIYISGAPAVRQPLTSAIDDYLTASTTSVKVAYNGTNPITANVISWEGATIAGNSINIKLTYNGSAAGWQAVAGDKTVRFLNDGLGTVGGNGSQTDVLQNTTASAATAIPDFTIADEWQVSTPWNGTNNIAYPETGTTAYTNLTDKINGILPVRLVASPAAPAGLSLTPNLVQTLYTDGFIRLSQLTGNSADYAKKVYPLSRGIDSGVRTLWATNNGFGATTPIQSWKPTVSLAGGRPVVGVVLTSGGSGYTSANITIAGPGGNGTTATANATVSGGKVTAINVINAGSGYTAAPAVTITGNSGSKLAAATAVIGGGNATSQVLYPSNTGLSDRIIGVDAAQPGDYGYPTFGALLTALTSTLTFGNTGDIYITPLTDADWQVAKAAGAVEVAWNGHTLGDLGTYGNSAGANTGYVGGSSSPALSNGQYDLWGYIRLVGKSTLSGVKLSTRDAISNLLKTTYNPVLLKDVNVQRSAPDGGAVFQGQIVAP